MAHIKVTHAGDGLQIHIEHPAVARLDPKVVEGCLHAVLDCAAKNACLQDRISLTAACVDVIAKHNTESRCLVTGLGSAQHKA